MKVKSFSSHLQSRCRNNTHKQRLSFLRVISEGRPISTNIINVAKYNLVRLELMQSAVSPLTARDLRGGPLGICTAFVSRCFSHALLLVDLCGSIALVSESLRMSLIKDKVNNGPLTLGPNLL